MYHFRRWFHLLFGYILSGVYVARCYLGQWCIALACRLYPAGLPRRELRQSLHVWRSKLDMHVALYRKNPDLNYRNYYDEANYDNSTESQADLKEIQKRAAQRAAMNRKNNRPKEDS